MNEILEKLFKKYFYTPIGLILGYILILLTIILQLDSFLEKGIPFFCTRVYIYLSIYVLWTFIWLYLKNYLPKNIKNKIGIVISINAENDKQKLRIRNDLVIGIENLLNKHQLFDLFNLVVLNDYKTIKVTGVLKKFGEKKNELLKKGENINNKIKEIRNFNHLKKRMRGHFFIYGIIKERKDIENKYFLNLDAIVLHPPVSMAISKKIAKEFITIFPREISFYEKLEFKGFKFASDVIYLAARYITGIAAFISGDPFTAHRLHKDLQKEFNRFSPIPPHLKHVSKELKVLLSTELLQMARYYYLIKHDIKKTKKLLNESENINPKDFSLLIFNSVYSFEVERNPLLSIKYLHKSRLVSKGDYTWLYNKAFIYMYLGKFKNGLNCYKKLQDISFPNENFIVDQCIEFNKELIKKEPQKKQSLFILGFLYYVKKNNFPMALEYFEYFRDSVCKDIKYDYLCKRVVTYLSEIKNKMKIK